VFDTPPLPLPPGITVLSVTDREVNNGKAAEGCVTVTINSVPK
jgi:hypothetical protein